MEHMSGCMILFIPWPGSGDAAHRLSGVWGGCRGAPALRCGATEQGSAGKRRQGLPRGRLGCLKATAGGPQASQSSHTSWAGRAPGAAARMGAGGGGGATAGPARPA